MNSWEKFKAEFKHAFALTHKDLELNESDEKFMVTLCYEIKARKLEAPAIIFFETCRPLQAIGPYAIQFASPIASFLINGDYINHLTELLEKPDALIKILDILEMDIKTFDQLREKYLIGPEYKEMRRLIALKKQKDKLNQQFNLLKGKQPLDAQMIDYFSINNR